MPRIARIVPGRTSARLVLAVRPIDRTRPPDPDAEPAPGERIRGHGPASGERRFGDGVSVGILGRILGEPPVDGQDADGHGILFGRRRWGRSRS